MPLPPGSVPWICSGSNPHSSVWLAAGQCCCRRCASWRATFQVAESLHVLEPRLALMSFACLCALAVGGWLLSLAKRDVSVVDPLWSLFFLTGTAVYGVAGHFDGSRALLIY